MGEDLGRLVWKKGNCVSDSIYGAERWGLKHDVPVRVAISKVSKDPDVDHAQAQALIGGKWEWLTVQDGRVSIYKQHFPVEPYRYAGLVDFMREQEGIEHVVPVEATLTAGRGR
jgi:hypothetical protein